VGALRRHRSSRAPDRRGRLRDHVADDERHAPSLGRRRAADDRRAGPRARRRARPLHPTVGPAPHARPRPRQRARALPRRRPPAARRGGGRHRARADRLAGAAAVVSEKRWIATNREWWDERVASHAKSTFYDLDAFRRGRDDLRPFEGDELGVDPGGLDLLHLQCHLGTDTLSWARRGARVVGLDFSGPAVQAATELARAVGLDDRAEFVQSNVYDARRELGGREFDVVYTGVGALSWLPDIERWARVA